MASQGSRYSGARRNTRTSQTQKGKHMCQFYDVDEENLITELKVFHSSYALPSNNVTAALKCLGENDVESFFLSLTMLLKMYTIILYQ